jgi:hypothetical protein
VAVAGKVAEWSKLPGELKLASNPPLDVKASSLKRKEKEREGKRRRGRKVRVTIRIRIRIRIRLEEEREEKRRRYVRRGWKRK